VIAAFSGLGAAATGGAAVGFVGLGVDVLFESLPFDEESDARIDAFLEPEPKPNARDRVALSDFLPDAVEAPEPSDSPPFSPPSPTRPNTSTSSSAGFSKVFL